MSLEADRCCYSSLWWTSTVSCADSVSFLPLPLLPTPLGDHTRIYTAPPTFQSHTLYFPGPISELESFPKASLFTNSGHPLSFAAAMAVIREEIKLCFLERNRKCGHMLHFASTTVFVAHNAFRNIDGAK